MIKLLSFKTRRPDLSFDAFRAHYEGEHVPLGLAYIDHFRWRRYVRNYVAMPVFGSVGFDCLTEFWVSGRDDQARTAAFVASPEFGVLDEDDRRFLDVTRRLSFEVEEHEIVGLRGVSESTGPDRFALLLTRPRSISPARFSAELIERARSFGARHGDLCDRIVLDLDVSEASEERIQAVLWVWLRGDQSPDCVTWQDMAEQPRVVRMTSVETPSDALFVDSSSETDAHHQEEA